MNNPDTTYLKDYGHQLVNNGYDIAPIPPGYKYPHGYVEWQTQDFNRLLDQILANGAGHDGVCVKFNGMVGIDIDSADPELARQMINFCHRRLGQCPVRYGRQPRAMLFYRVDHDQFKTTSSKFRDPMGSTHQIEVLGKGQQGVVYAIHPDTLSPYTWENDFGLAQLSKDQLPVITPQQIDELISYFHAHVPAYWTEAAKGASNSAAPIEELAILDHIKPPLKLTEAEVRGYMSELVNDKDYYGWLDVGMALYHQFDGDPIGYQIWDEWAASHPRYSESYGRKKWPSFEADVRNTNPITFATVIKMVQDQQSEQIKPKHSGNRFVNFSTELDDIKPPVWAVDGFIEENTVGMIFGDFGSYKSFLAIDIALHIASGKDWHGHKVTQGTAFLIEGEGHAGLIKRGRAWRDYHKADIENKVFRTQVASELMKAKEVTEIKTDIEATCDHFQVKPAIIVVDTLARNFGIGDENNATDMGMFVRHVDHLRETFKCPVLIIHHSGKGDKKTARGSTALPGACDFIFKAEKTSDLNVKLECMKMKDSEMPADVHFRGEKVYFKDSSGGEIDSLVFHPVAAPVAERKELKGKQKELYELIVSLKNEDGFAERDDVFRVALEEEIYSSRNSLRMTLGRIEDLNWIENIDNKIIDLGWGE